jgi:MFS family permease
MYVITVFLAIGYLMLAAAVNKWMLFFGRIVIGFGTGVTTIAIPVYVSEIASPNVRGMLGSFFQVMVTIGVLYVDIVGAFVSWRWISVACVGMTLIWSVMLLFIPESPGNNEILKS